MVGCNIMPQQKKTQSDRLEKLHQDPVESHLISNGGPCGTEERLVVDPFPETNQCRMSSFNPCNFKVDTETEFHRKGRSKKTKSDENVDPDDAKRHCFICNEANAEEKVMKVRQSSFPQLKQRAMAINNPLITNGLNTDIGTNDGVGVHKSCDIGFLNQQRDLERDDEKETEETDQTRPKRLHSILNESLSEELPGDRHVFLPYKDICVLCYTAINFHPRHRKSYRNPESLTYEKAKKRFMNIAERRLDKNPSDSWAIEVKGRLAGMGDLVA